MQEKSIISNICSLSQKQADIL